MATATTSKLVNVAQLAGEMGLALSARTSAGSTTVYADCDQTTLDAALAAHVAVDEESNATTLRSRAGTALQTNRDFLALAAPANADVVAQVKALTRQNNGIIRLILGRLEGTN
jgi:hypothetical protein